MEASILQIANCFDKKIKKPKSNKEEKHHQTKNLQQIQKRRLNTHLAKLMLLKVITKRPRMLKVEKLRLLNIEK
jgi:hypothetical protein